MAQRISPGCGRIGCDCPYCNGDNYDRYISAYQHNKEIIKVGVGFSFQKIDKLPINKYMLNIIYRLYIFLSTEDENICLKVENYKKPAAQL